VAEVAELLRLNQQTVRNWIDQGALPALRVGRRVRIKRSDLDRLLTDGYNAGSHAAAADAGPSAEDFWGGEPVGIAELAAGEPDAGVPDATAAESVSDGEPGGIAAENTAGAPVAGAAVGVDDAPAAALASPSTNGAESAAGPDPPVT
jgi:excisionase family DNA binding protein